jgi:hypothetical protein
MAELWKGWRFRLRLPGDGAGSVSRSRLAGGAQRFQECNQSRRFRGTQILAVSRHVSSALDHLANELILGAPHGHFVEGRTPFSANIIKGVTIVALLALKHERTLPFQRGPIV